MSYQDDNCSVPDKPGFESDRILNAKNFTVVKYWVASEKIVHYRRPIDSGIYTASGREFGRFKNDNY